MRARGTLPFYIGGFLGPFGGGVVAVLVPQLREAFDATTAGVALSIPAYLVPFALLQLVSGTLGERLGRRRVVRTGYIVYAALSLAAAFVPNLGAFLVVRALQGSANAFLTPLLLAGLADEVPPRQIGRAVGTFAAVQTAGGRARAARRRRAGGDRLAAGVHRAGRGGRRARADAARRRGGPRGRRRRRCGRSSRGASGCSAPPRSSATRASPASASSSRCWPPTTSAWSRSRAASCSPASGSRGSWSGGRPATPSTATGACRSRRVGVVGLLGAGRAAGHRAVAGRARRAVVRDRARLDARLGRDQHARRRGRARTTARAGRRSSRPSGSRATPPRR